MSRLTQAEIRNNAVAFVHEWKGESRERAESQSFWNEFLSIFGDRSFKIVSRQISGDDFTLILKFKNFVDLHQSNNKQACLWQ